MKRVALRVILFFVCMICSVCGYCQESMRDSVFLMDKTVITGSVIETKPQVKVLSDVDYGHIYTFDRDEVVKIIKDDEVVFYKEMEYVGHKSGLLAGVLNYCLPGVGYFYLNQPKKALTHIGIYLGSGVMLFTGFISRNTVLGGAAFFLGLAGMGYSYIFTVIDGVRTARKINMNDGYLTVSLSKEVNLGVTPSLIYSQSAFSSTLAENIGAGLGVRLSF